MTKTLKEEIEEILEDNFNPEGAGEAWATDFEKAKTDLIALFHSHTEEMVGEIESKKSPTPKFPDFGPEGPRQSDVEGFQLYEAEIDGYNKGLDKAISILRKKGNI